MDVKFETITYPEFKRLRSYISLSDYGHKFRFSKKCPKHYHLLKDETGKGYFKAYQFTNRHKVYHSWECS